MTTPNLVPLLQLGTCVEIDPDAPPVDNGEEEEEEGGGRSGGGERSAPTVVAKYELVESWSQTLDFSKKKKGTQCDDIEIENVTTQVIFWLFFFG